MGDFSNLFGGPGSITTGATTQPLQVDSNTGGSFGQSLGDVLLGYIQATANQQVQSQGTTVQATTVSSSFKSYLPWILILGAGVLAFVVIRKR